MFDKPDLARCVDALLCADSRFGVEPTAEEADVAETLRWISDVHRGGSDDPDAPAAALCDRHWGFCVECGHRWPCPQWSWAQQLAVQFLGRAADRYAARAAARIRRTQRETA